MSEIEAFRHMDAVPDPSREIFVRDLAAVKMILRLNKLFQINELEIFVVSEISQEIFNRYESVMVSIQSEECFSYAIIVVA